MCILIVDDEPEIRQVLREFLVEEGIRSRKRPMDARRSPISIARPASLG